MVAHGITGDTIRKVRIVLDTSSFIASIRSVNGAAKEVMRMVFNGEVIPLMDLKLGLEYRDVALRPEHLEASQLSKTETLALVETLEAFSEGVEVWMRTRPLSSDPDDDMVLQLALSGRAEAIVTHNVKHFRAAGKRLGMPVLSPSQFLQQLDRGADGNRKQ